MSRLAIWLSRIGCCRGFGVQSPWAYAFVRYVISEHFPYYGYAELRSRFPDATESQHKMARFYLRLANFAQPAAVYSLWQDAKENRRLADAAFLAGCRRCQLVNLDIDNAECGKVLEQRQKEKPIIVCCNAAESRGRLKELLTELHKGDLVVVEDIKCNREWQELRREQNGVLMFDLFYCGVVYVDPDRYMQHYRINF